MGVPLWPLALEEENSMRRLIKVFGLGVGVAMLAAACTSEEPTPTPTATFTPAATAPAPMPTPADEMASGDRMTDAMPADDMATDHVTTDEMAAMGPMEADIQSFTLPDMTVQLGTTINWTNGDRAPHTSTAGQSGVWNGSGWDSMNMLTGQSFSHTFDHLGTFGYTCTIPPSMNGTITVVAEGADVATSGPPVAGELDY